MKNRLSKILAGAGIASRRAAEEIVFEGRVTVNGDTIRIPQTMVDPEVDRITVDGAQVARLERKLYYLLNKPKGFVCSTKPGSELRSVLDIFGNVPERLFTVGRLDVETTGLILVTNDGHFANKVIHPRSNIDKEYLVKTVEEVQPAHLVKLSKGTFVEGVFVKPVRVKKIRRGTLKITVKEGRKREVRRMCQNAGLKVIALSRIRIGSLHLGNLALGAFRPLRLKEREDLVKSG